MHVVKGNQRLLTILCMRDILVLTINKEGAEMAEETTYDCILDFRSDEDHAGTYHLKIDIIDHRGTSDRIIGRVGFRDLLLIGVVEYIADKIVQYTGAPVRSVTIPGYRDEMTLAPLIKDCVKELADERYRS